MCMQWIMQLAENGPRARNHIHANWVNNHISDVTIYTPLKRRVVAEAAVCGTGLTRDGPI